MWKSGSHLWHEAERERHSERTLNSSRDTRTDSKLGLLTWLQTWVILYSNMLSRLCDGFAWADCFSLKCKHIKDKIKGSSWFFFKDPKFIPPGFSWGLCGFSMTPAHLHKFHLMQLIINITVTPQVSYIPNLYSENIWRTEFNLDNFKNTFCDDHLLNIFGVFLA